MTSLAYPENLQAGFPGIFLNFFRVAVILAAFLRFTNVWSTLPWRYFPGFTPYIQPV